ncbi:unnamed protein product [Prunus armeniaca]|uniref:Uncharacterized protein n=1 Tax=Prunus armeniaca TaxID=36596 RepID=A0A6J5TIG6_PRUAR|nr:unnamed protein product [Prunus armeniaca]CAB4294010.1 unnamed protein product [Prunus armeniaca]
MDFSRTYLFVLFTTLLLLSSSCFGDQGSADIDLKRPIKRADQHPLLKDWIKRQVLSGPNPLHDMLPPKVDDAKNYRILNEVPSGPNPLHNILPPQLDDPTNHQILRELPSSPNPLHHILPPQQKFDDPANHQFLREVPSGPNPLHDILPPQQKFDDPAVCANNLTGEYSLLDPSTFDLPSLSSSIPVKHIGGVNRAAGAVCGGRSRVEKIWRVEREKERASGIFLGEVRSGPNPLHHNVPPQKKLDDPENYHLTRLVPTGPNQEESPEEPPEFDDSPAHYHQMRVVPTGPNQEESPEEPPELDDNPANYHLNRLVPTGPNRAESPEELPSRVLSGPPPQPSPVKANLLKLRSRRLLGIPI